MQPIIIIGLSPYASGSVVISGVPGLLIGADGTLGLCEKTLAHEMARLKRQGVATLVGLVDDDELGSVAYEDIAEAAQGVGVTSIRLPLRDFAVPTPAQEEEWAGIKDHAVRLFRQGQSLAIHCMAGIGRSGTMAGCLLVHLGMAPQQALARIRALQPEALETEEQLAYLLSRRPAAP
jgi:protein-tyrosine phosphatase